jgi:hypothetical protein
VRPLCGALGQRQTATALASSKEIAVFLLSCHNLFEKEVAVPAPVGVSWFPELSLTCRLCQLIMCTAPDLDWLAELLGSTCTSLGSRRSSEDRWRANCCSAGGTA